MNGKTLLVLGLLTIALAFDPAHLLSMALLAAFLHECGHALVFVLLTGHRPCLRPDGLGVSLSVAQTTLSTRQECWLLLAGPGANLIATGVTICLMQHSASYGGWFFACANLLLGLFNLLPVGYLDGGRLLRCLLPAGRQNIARAVSAAVCVAGVCAAAACVLHGMLRPGLAALVVLVPAARSDQL